MIGYIWARESNQDDVEVYSLKSQLDACREAAAADGVPVTPDREFKVQFSGRDLRAIPEMRQLRETLERNSAEKQRVYCYTQDRLIRGEEAIDIFYLIVEFRHFNAEVQFVRNPVDTKSLFGQVMLLFGGHKSSTEIDDIRDRTMRGKIRRVKEGKLPNYGIEKFGYRRNKEIGKAEINKEEWAILQRIKRLYLDERYGAGEIATLFNAEGVPTPMRLKRGQNSRWWHSTITKLLRDEAYKGTGYALRYKSKFYNTKVLVKRPREEWIEIPAAYPPLFTPEEWGRLQALIDANNCNRERKSKTPGTLRGLAVCDLCGGRLYPNWAGWTRADGSQVRYLYYFCQWNARKDGAHPGNYNRVKTEDLDAWAWEKFATWLRGQSFADDLRHFQNHGLADKLAREAEEAGCEITAKTRQLENLLGQARDVAPQMAKLLHAEIERVASEREAVAERLRRIERDLADEASRENLIAELLNLRDEIVGNLESLNEQGRREILQVFYVKVFVGGKSRENWRFTSLVVPDTRS